MNVLAEGAGNARASSRLTNLQERQQQEYDCANSGDQNPCELPKLLPIKIDPAEHDAQSDFQAT